MITTSFHKETLPLLGFGTMRLPLGENREIDFVQTEKMMDTAMAAGVNYFDTGWPYHSCKAELVVGEILQKYPRDSFFLADKFPGHQILKDYHPAPYFETQLKKCRVDYFDFYLLHNVYEKSIEQYTDPKWGIMDYLREQKKQGRIHYLGISTHGNTETLRRFLDLYGEDLDFCQIQLNYVDWTLQHARERVELLSQRGIPVWVMEPVRGGKLATLTPEQRAKLPASLAEASPVEIAFRWLQGLNNVQMILSGMSAPAQLEENLAIFSHRNPLTEKENEALLALAEEMKQAIPCTGCRYCCDGCPKGLDIPLFIQKYNELKYNPSVNAVMAIEAMPEEKKPAACISCGQCTGMCPQKIDVPAVLSELPQMVAALPTWEKLSKIREEDAAKIKW